MSLGGVRIVLVEPRGPVNIGAVARAVKNMGAGALALVKPRCPPLHPHALTMAAGAKDVLMAARVCDSLEEAVSPCALVVGTTRRPRKGLKLVPLREAAPKVLEVAGVQEVAILFGPEDRGLSNEELEACHMAVTIPADPVHGSLNLAQAVMVVLYELRAYSQPPPPPQRRLATAQELEGLFRHMEEVLLKVGFLDPQNPRRMMAELRRMVTRAGLDPREVRILRGVLHQIEWALSRRRES